MRIKELANKWNKNPKPKLNNQLYEVMLPNIAAAKVEALADMFTSGNVQDLLEDLVLAAIKEVEDSMPYIEGESVIGSDECGDPIFEDIGPTPKFLALAREHLQRITVVEDEQEQAANLA